MSIASILIDALKDKLTPYEQTELITGFADLERPGSDISVTRMMMGTLTMGTQDGVTVFHPTGPRAIVLEPSGNAFFGSDVDDPAKTSLAVFSESRTYNDEALGAGDLLVGDNSDGKANMLWDASAGRLNFRGGTNTYVYIDTDGSIVAQQGEIGGWNIGATTIYDDNSSIVLDSANEKITVGTGGSSIVIDGANEVIKSSAYSPGTTGWQIDSAGDAEFNNIYARGKIAAAAFEYDNVTAVGGKMLLSKNASVVWANFTTPSAISGSAALYLENQNQGTTAVAQTGDIIYARIWNGTTHVEFYGTVTYVGSDQGGYRQYNYTLQSGDTSTQFNKGTPVINLGPSGYGVMQLEAGATTRMRIFDHTGSPWTTYTDKVAIGNMKNLYGTGANDRYGFGVGDYSGENYLSYNAEAAGAFIISAGGGDIKISASGIRIDDNDSSVREVQWRYDTGGANDYIGGVWGDYGGGADATVTLRGYRASGDPWTYSGVMLSATDAVNSKNIRLWLTTDGTNDGWAQFLGARMVQQKDGALIVGDISPSYSAGEIWAEKNIDTAKQFHARGQSIPASGVGLEMYWNGTQSDVLSYDRDATAYKPLRLRGSTVEIRHGSGNNRGMYFDGTYIYHHNDDEPISRRIENAFDYAHEEWTTHWDGDYSAMVSAGYAWRTHGSFSTPGGQAEARSRLYCSYNQVTGNAFFAKATAAGGMHFLPYIYCSQTPVRVGVRWDDGSDNNLVQVYWEITIDGSGLPICRLYMQSVNGGGAPTTTQLLPDIPAGVPLPDIRAHVEGTKWTSWSVRCFMRGAMHNRWLQSHGGKTWMPSYSGMFWANASGGTASWQYWGFDAFHLY